MRRWYRKWRASTSLSDRVFIITSWTLVAFMLVEAVFHLPPVLLSVAFVIWAIVALPCNYIFIRRLTREWPSDRAFARYIKADFDLSRLSTKDRVLVAALLRSLDTEPATEAIDVEGRT